MGGVGGEKQDRCIVARRRTATFAQAPAGWRYLGCLSCSRIRTPARSARDTSSGKDRTCIFSITLWRWALMVRSVQPSARATCLLMLPRMTSSKTSRSRGVNRPTRAREHVQFVR